MVYYDSNFTPNTIKESLYNKNIIETTSINHILTEKEQLARNNFRKALNSVLFSPEPHKLFEALEEERNHIESKEAIKQAVIINKELNKEKERNLNNRIQDTNVFMEVENVNDKLDIIKTEFNREVTHVIRAFKETSCREILDDLYEMKSDFSNINILSNKRESHNREYNKILLQKTKELMNVKKKEDIKQYNELKDFHLQYRTFTEGLIKQLEYSNDAFKANCKKTIHLLKDHERERRRTLRKYNSMKKISKLKTKAGYSLSENVDYSDNTTFEKIKKEEEKLKKENALNDFGKKKPSYNQLVESLRDNNVLKLFYPSLANDDGLVEFNKNNIESRNKSSKSLSKKKVSFKV